MLLLGAVRIILFQVIVHTEFAPNDNITREQMVSILKRFAEYKQIDTSISDTLDSYSDTEYISIMLFLLSNGLAEMKL